MKFERWHINNKKIELLHDENHAFFLKDKTQKISLKELNESNSDKVPLATARRNAVKSAVEDEIKVNPQQLKQHFYKHEQFEDAQKVDSVDFSELKVKSGKFVNDVRFLGASFLEGFLGFYGLELDNAVDKYEMQLRAYEEENLNTNEKNVFLGRMKNGELNQLSPNLKTPENAEKRLQEFKEYMKQSQPEQQHEKTQKLERKRELEQDE